MSQTQETQVTAETVDALRNALNSSQAIGTARELSFAVPANLHYQTISVLNALFNSLQPAEPIEEDATDNIG